MISVEQMIASTRYNGGGGRTTAMSKECRMMNGGGGYVNRCEQELGDKNEMVMAASKIGVAPGGDQSKLGYPSSSTEVTLKEWTLSNLSLIDTLKVQIVHKDKMIQKLSKEVEHLKLKLNKANEQLTENAAREESLDVLPFTPVSSICSSVVGDLCLEELPESQDVKPKKRKSRQTTIKQVNPDQLEPNQTKRQKTRSTRVKSDDVNKMQELSLITADNAYYTCLGNYEPIDDDLIPENSKNNLEIPSWRVKTYSSWYSMEGTENMSDDIFENRHCDLELKERRRKRWDMQRIRELRRIEYLKKGRNKNQSQNVKEELTTLLPNPVNITAIEITNNLPVSAFGSNLHVEKKSELYTFYHSQWYNNGDQVLPQQSNVRGLRSSCRNKLYDTA